MKEIKLVRIDIATVTDALVWSDDGQIAVNSGQSVTILAPRQIKDEEIDTQYSQRETPALEQGSVSYIDTQLSGFAADEQFSLMSYSTEHCVTDIAWGPSGIGTNGKARRGCLLTVLTTRGECLVYESIGQAAFAHWRVCWRINEQMVIDWKLEGTNGCTDSTARRLRVHSICWSGPGSYQDDENKWGSSFLLLGNESREVLLYKVNDDGLKYSGELVIEGLQGEWTNLMAFARGGELDAVAIGTERNEVIVKSVHYKDGGLVGEGDDEIVNAACRFRLSKLQWHNTATTRILVASFVGMVKVSVFDINFKVDAHLSATVLATAETSGIVIYDVDENTTRIVVTSCKGDTSALNLVKTTEGYDLQSHYGTDTLSQFIANRKNIAEDGVESVDLRVYSTSIHPQGKHVAMCYSVYQGRKLRYPVMSEHVRRIGFLPLSSLSAGDPHPLWPILRGSSMATWWTNKVLLRSGRRADRQTALETNIAHLKQQLSDFEIVIEDHKSLEDQSMSLDSALSILCRSLRALFSDENLDYARLLEHYEPGSQDKRILQALAKIVLRAMALAGTQEYSEIDCALLQSYRQIVPEEGAVAGLPDEKLITLKDSGKGMFEETFNFLVAGHNLESITSTSEHDWRRCSVTLLPLMCVDVLTCGGCGRRCVKELADESSVVAKILEVIDVCIYCGGRFYERV